MTTKKRVSAMNPGEFERFWRTEIRAKSLNTVRLALQSPFPTVRDWNYDKNPIPGVAKAALEFWKKSLEYEKRFQVIQQALDNYQNKDPREIVEEIRRAMEDPAPLQREEESLWDPPHKKVS